MSKHSEFEIRKVRKNLYIFKSTYNCMTPAEIKAYRKKYEIILI